MTRKTVGILGGMGARASVRFYDEVIQSCTAVFGVQENDQFPRLLISNLPIPDIIGDNSNPTIARRMIVEEGKRLVQAGAECLIMACNTAHVALPQLRQSVSVEVLDLVAETVAAVPLPLKRVGVLATPTTLLTELYQQALAKQGKTTLLPTRAEQAVLENAIRTTIAGTNGRAETRRLIKITNRLQRDGAAAVILGCTELGLILSASDLAIPMIDSVVAGANKVARIGLGKV